MTQLIVVVPLVLLTLSNNLVTCRRRTQSSNNSVDVERPLVEALSPKGLRVSLPHVNGMELFAFHGNLNSPIRRFEQGGLDKDILFPTNGQWVFEDREVQLRIGDVINYWIFVQINGMGYRLDNLSTIVRELVHQGTSSVSTTSRPINYLPTISTISETSQNDHRCTNRGPTTTRNICNCNCNAEQYATITAQLNVTLDQLQTLHDKMAPLYAQIESLTESLQEVIKDMNIGTQLLLTGNEPPGTNALEAVRELITEKLGLLDLDQNIRQAYRTSEGILFEMSSPMDKKRIIFRANKRLKNSGYKIEDPQRTSNSVGFLNQENNYQTERTQNRPSENNLEPMGNRRTPSFERPTFDVRSSVDTLIQDSYYSPRRRAIRNNLSMRRYEDSRAQSVENHVKSFSNIQAETQENPFSNTRTILSSQQHESPVLTIVQSTVATPIKDSHFIQNQNSALEIQQDDLRIQEVPTRLRQESQSSTRVVSSDQRAQSADNRRTSSEKRLNISQNP